MAARLFARLFGLRCEPASGHFWLVRVDDTLMLDLSDATGFDAHHDAFQVDDAEFDAILMRMRAEGIAWGSGPGALDDRQLNGRHGHRGGHFRARDGRVPEPMTQAP